MADGTEDFEFINVEQIELEAVRYDDRSKKAKLKVTGGIYKAASSDKAVFTPLQYYLTLDTLQSRFKDPDLRQSDFEALQKDLFAKPFELWNKLGSPMDIPTNLILYSSGKTQPYSKELDARQLDVWEKMANDLGGKSGDHVNPMYQRFLLRPGALKDKKELLYCSPANPPAFGVDKAKLEAVIKANTGKFDGWPDPIVVDFNEAEREGLRLVGWNFLQFYFTWMKAGYYEELWKQYGVTELLHALPGEGDNGPYEDVDTKILKQVRPGLQVDEVPIPIVTNSSDKREGTETIMGKSATVVADKLWKKGYITSGMGGTVKVEWLHRVAHSFRGKQADTFPNIVFGTWECNTDMVRAENFVRKLADKCEDKGMLTTVNKTPGALSRRNPLQATNSDTTIPTWAGKYSWLCFSLKYRYEMDRCPLDGNVAHEVDFDPWAIYTPLSMEPRLDFYILRHLKSAGSSTDLATDKIDGDGYQTLAWKAAINGLPSVELPDIVVQNPAVASPPVPEGLVDGHSNRSISVDTPVPKGGFLLHGEVDLFRTGVVGNLEKWVGPGLENVFVGTEFLLIERVVFPGEFHLSMLIPLLHGTAFDNIIFCNVAITYQNAAFDKTKSVGWHFNADWVIDPSCGLLYDILRTALQVDKPILSIHAGFGKSLQWTVPLNVQGLILEGVFPNLTLSPVSGLTLTSIGVRLLGIRGFSFTPKPHSTLSYGFGVFGTMKLAVPGSIVPLNLDYEIGLVGKTVNLRAETPGLIWEDALGVKGLLLQDVVFGTSFSVAFPWNTFAFDVAATFSYLSSVANLQGSYAAGGHFSLSAELDNFGINELNDFFYTLFGNFLTLPDYDVHIGSATISIVSGQGLSMSLLDVNVAGYTAASLQVSFLTFSGSLSKSLKPYSLTYRVGRLVAGRSCRPRLRPGRR